MPLGGFTMNYTDQFTSPGARQARDLKANTDFALKPRNWGTGGVTILKPEGLTTGGKSKGLGRVFSNSASEVTSVGGKLGDEETGPHTLAPPDMGQPTAPSQRSAPSQSASSQPSSSPASYGGGGASPSKTSPTPKAFADPSSPPSATTDPLLIGAVILVVLFVIL